MADTLSLWVTSIIDWEFDEGADLATIKDWGPLEYAKKLTDGTGANQVNLIWHDERTLAGSGNESLNLKNLTRTIYGSTVTYDFASVKVLAISNTNTVAADDLYIDGTVASAWNTAWNTSTTSKVEIAASGALLMVNPIGSWAVDDIGNDILNIVNDSTNSVTYRILIAGLTA